MSDNGPRALLVKCRKDEDFYVAWSEGTEAPVWYGAAAEARKEGYTQERIDRADETGTSSVPGFYSWDHDILLAGVLDPDRLADRCPVLVVRAEKRMRIPGRERVDDLFELFGGSRVGRAMDLPTEPERARRQRRCRGRLCAFARLLRTNHRNREFM